MTNHGLDLFLRHALQQAGGDCDECRVFECASSKCIGLAFINRHFRHADAGFVGKLLDRVHDPNFIRVLRCGNHARTGAPLCHGLANQQRDERAGKTHDQGIHHQCGNTQAAGAHEAVKAKDAGDHAEHQHHSHIG